MEFSQLRQAMHALVADKGDALDLQRKVHELEFQLAGMKFKLTESECDRDVCVAE